MIVLATFKDGRTVKYTDSVLSLLISDPDVETVINAETGEIIK